MIVAAALAALALSPMPAHLIAFAPNTKFPDKGASVTQTFGPFEASVPFDEAIVSWNVEHPEGAVLKVEARAIQDGVPTKWYTMADWSYDTSLHPRESINGQKDDHGTVDTDTLRLKQPAQQIELNVTMQNDGTGEAPSLKYLSVCFSDTQDPKADEPKASDAWGKTLDVPERAQNNYPNGGVLCSATSVSMMLWHYANVLNRPELNQDVPVVESMVWDSVFKGAGNWPFNTAYAGSFPGMRAYVARFAAISDLEKWIAAGLPVVCSVSFDLLRGKPLSPEESGHLIVLVGFTKDGDPVVNDPAFKDSVRKSYPRADFEKAWLYSHRTVYLIYPADANVPTPSDGLWAGK